jgi:uncharacterized membrane protein YfcA
LDRNNGSKAGWVTEAIAIGIVCAIAAALHASIGFGAGLIAAPLLVLIDPRFVPGPLLLCIGLLALAMLIRDRIDLRIERVGWALVGCTIGSALAAVLFDRLSPRVFGFIFAGLVLVAVAISASGRSPRLTRNNSVIAGALAGLMGTLCSIGGPPVALLFQRQPGPEIRANLAAYFILSTVIGLAALFSVGRLGATELTSAMILLPGFGVGYLVSFGTTQLADRGSTRPLILVVSALSAIVVLAQNLSSGS